MFWSESPATYLGESEERCLEPRTFHLPLESGVQISLEDHGADKFGDNEGYHSYRVYLNDLNTPFQSERFFIGDYPSSRRLGTQAAMREAIKDTKYFIGLYEKHFADLHHAITSMIQNSDN